MPSLRGTPYCRSNLAAAGRTSRLLRFARNDSRRFAAVGVDNGGTWIRFKGLNTRGRCVWTLKKPSPSVEDLPAFLKKHLQRFHGGLAALAVGSRGVWKPSKCRAMKRALRGLAKTIVVMSDVEAAWLAAFSKEGIIVIAGTGSIAYGKRGDGVFARAGGLGPDKGDEGSGYWIGREWLLRKTRARPSAGGTTSVVRQVASLAPKVIHKARRGDPVALKIVRQAQAELAALVRDVKRQLRLENAAVSWAGSVMANDWFRKGVWKILTPPSLKRQSARTDASTALARSIMSRASR